MASAVSGLYLTKGSSDSYLTATLQIIISDFLQGKYTCLKLQVELPTNRQLELPKERRG